VLTSGQLRGANVLLVTIDTLRRDRLGAYGSTAGLTPTLDRLAAAGVRYSHAYSHVPMTLPAHTSILTGLTPRRHGVHNNVAFRLEDEVPTIATLLKSAGYRTGAFVGAFVLDARFGLSRGFDLYDDRYPHPTGTSTFRFTQRTAADVVTAAGDWILSRSPGIRRPAAETGAAVAQPWFAWVHLFDPHTPYEAPPGYRAGRSPYDAEVAYTDAMLGQFLDRLRAAHALDRTLIVVTADHGESLGEHGEATHGLFAYDATLAVPLIVNGPSIGARTIDTLAAHVDILPTIADLTAVPAPSGLDGRSLADVSTPERAVYFEALDAHLTRDWAPLTGIVRGGWKLIDLPIRELYDLGTDAHENTNLAARDSSRVGALARALADVTTRPATTARSSTVDTDAAARLRALGYTSGGSAARARPHTDADDPKRLVALNEQFNVALEAFSDGRRDEALAAFRALLAERPDFVTARTSAATVLLSAGRAAEAIQLLEAAPGAQATSPEVLAKLGAALRDAGEASAAARAFEKARDTGNRNPELLNDLGVLYARLSRAADARAMFNALLTIDPNAAGTWYNLGLLDMSQHQAAAAAAFRHAVEADPSYADAWQALGAAVVARDRAEAIDAWRRAEALQPRDFDLLFNLGTVLAESERPADALPYLERFLREAPRDRYGRDVAGVEALIAKLRR
jgi:arylsulfatase A-like enzyme/Flp pilus assembly protein TadD